MKEGWGRFCRMVGGVNVSGKVKELRCGGEGKGSLKGGLSWIEWGGKGVR